MHPVGWFAWHEVRTRWRSVAGLALLVAVTGGLVLAAAAGARRTESVVDRFTQATGARDATVQLDADDPAPLLEEIEQLDVVAGAARVDIHPVAPTDPAIETTIDLSLFGAADGRWRTEVDRPLVLAGRPPADDAVDEVLLNEVAAAETGLDVGDRFEVATFTPEQLDAVLSGGEFTGFGGPALTLEVVGIGRQAMDLQGADVSAGGVLHVSRAVVESLEGRAGAFTGLLAVRLAPGVTVADLREGVRAVVGDGSFDVRSSDEEYADSLRDATGVLGRALWSFAAVAAAAAAVAVGGTITRQSVPSRSTAPLLAAIGWERRRRIVALSAVPVAGVGVGAALAVLVAVLASSRFPLSLAARAEPDPGIHVDAPVLAAGAATILLAGVAWSLVVLRRIDARRPAVRRPARRAALALPPTTAIGVGHAFERRADARTPPGGAGIAAAVLGVVGVVAAATVVASFDRLVEDPQRYGWAWSSEPDVFSEDLDATIDDLAATDGVAAVAVRHNARLELGGAIVEGVAFEARHGTIQPPLRAGRLPVGPEEVAIGQHTADELGASVGDRIPARPADGGDPVDVEVVGIGVLAPVEAADPAAGGIVTPEGLELLRRSDGFSSVLLDYEPGFDPSALERSLEEREVADFSVYSRPRLPGGLENLDRAMPVVTALGAFFAALGVAGVGHGLVIGTRRRRRELGTLRALGMRRADVRRIVATTALGTVGAGLVLGLPLGLAAGRAVWREVVGSQGVIDTPAVPVVALVVLVPGALLTALATSWWPGRTAARAAGTDLRAE